MEAKEVDETIDASEQCEKLVYLPLIQEIENFGCTEEYLRLNLHHLKKHVERVANKISLLNTKKDREFHQIFRYLILMARTLLAVTTDLKKRSRRLTASNGEENVICEEVTQLKITQV